MSTHAILEITISEIPLEGRSLEEELTAEGLRVDGTEGFVLRPGASLHGRVERNEDESVHVQGRLKALLGLECDRCTSCFELALDQEVEMYSLPHGADGAVEDEDEVELTDRDMVISYHGGDRLALGELIREQLVLALPMGRACRSGCRGLCPQCGTNRNDAECDCVAEEPASPFAALKGMLGGRSH